MCNPSRLELMMKRFYEDKTPMDFYDIPKLVTNAVMFGYVNGYTDGENDTIDDIGLEK